MKTDKIFLYPPNKMTLKEYFEQTGEERLDIVYSSFAQKNKIFILEKRGLIVMNPKTFFKKDYFGDVTVLIYRDKFNPKFELDIQKFYEKKKRLKNRMEWERVAGSLPNHDGAKLLEAIS